MECFVLGGIGNHFLLLADERSGELNDAQIQANPIFCKSSDFGELTKKSYPGSFLRETLNNEIEFSNREYIIITCDNFKIIKKKSYFSFFTSQNKTEQNAIYYARYILSNFSLRQRKQLIENIFCERVSFKRYLKTFMKYVFCDGYSFWIYNPITETFTCVVSSNEYTKDYVERCENTTLNDAIADGYTYESRPPGKNCELFDFREAYKSINRVKISLGESGEFGVLSFFSTKTDFFIKDNINDIFSNILRAKYKEHNQETQERFEESINHFVSDNYLDSLDEFFRNLSRVISNSLHYEACSIYLYDKSDNELVLIAVNDRLHAGKPSEPQSYGIDDESMTASVLRDEKMIWSYDLNNDPLNSKKHSETVKLTNRSNWIGIPIIDGTRKLGVLRVKNKYILNDKNKRVLSSFRPIDFTHLQLIREFITGVIKIHGTYNAAILSENELKHKMEQQSDFDTVFLHEVRTPIQTFSSAPERMIDELKSGSITDEKITSVINKLHDISALALRLKFITNTYYFEKIVKSRNYEYLTILKDVIYPVTNITRHYIKRQLDIDIDVNHGLLNAKRVYGDKILLNIVVNALIDNATKYAGESRRSIIVDGKYSKTYEYFLLIVSNWGLEIHADEKQSIFEKGVRGHEAKLMTEGTGIGLYLSRRIMRESGGDLILESRKNPVTFVMKIPTEKEVVDQNG